MSSLAQDPMSRVVRVAGSDDLPAVFALRHEVFVVGQQVPAELERDEHDAGCEHVVALDDGVVVGTGRLLSPAQLGRGDGVGVVGRLAVAQDVRGSRAGAALLAALEQRAHERGFGGVELHAQVHAVGFYERAGYVATGEPYDEAGIAHITMGKALLG